MIFCRIRCAADGGWYMGGLGFRKVFVVADILVLFYSDSGFGGTELLIFSWF